MSLPEDHLHREPTCLVCGNQKKPMGRDVPQPLVRCRPEECEGYHEYPVPSQLFEGEIAEPVPDEAIVLTRIEFTDTIEGLVLAIGSIEACNGVAQAMPAVNVTNDTDRFVFGADVVVMKRDQDGIRDLKRGDRYLVSKEESDA
ncbi:MAG: hypothetical protein OXU81_21880 [Gammaproteobacteria bacterium]|nr:hypothetical protein [Gammaproteobacteria bacterium]